MTIRRSFILFLIALSASALSANGGAQAPDNKGTDFFLAFPQNLNGSADSAHRLTLFVAADEATTVEVSGPEVVTQTFDIAAGTVLERFYASSIPQVSLPNQVGNEGIRVRSIVRSDPSMEGPPIAVFALNRRPGSAGAYTALPVNVLGLEYRALARPAISPISMGSQVTIVATQAETTVYITTLVDVPGVTTAGVPKEVVLNTIPPNTIETFLLQLDNGDLTGTLVTADKPIAVFSGNQNGTVVGESADVADHMIEQMPPISTWGRDYIIVPIVPRTAGTDGDRVRVLAHENGTIVTVNGDDEGAVTLQAGGIHEFDQSPTAATRVTTSRRTLVVQFKKELTRTENTGPFAMLVPPVSHFSHQYLFRTPGMPFSGMTGLNRLNIVVPDGYETSLMLNNQTISANLWTPPLNTPAFNGYRYARVKISPGATHKLEHPEPAVRFGAWIYGQAAVPIKGILVGEGYGFAAGQQLFNRPPICSEAVASTTLIWPPNHQLVSIGVNGVSDRDNDDVIIEIATIRQDEPTNDTGDGNTAIDGFGVGTSVAQVRAERSGGGNGRVYHIGFTATDPWGGSCSGDVTVGVPHDQGKKGAPVDDGAVYDSTGL